MEFTRNHYLIVGMLLLLLGIQFRVVQSYTLNEKTSRFIEERMRAREEAAGGIRTIFASIGPTPHRVIHPPDWLGWALMSTGAVLVLQSLAMKKPGAG